MNFWIVPKPQSKGKRLVYTHFPIISTKDTTNMNYGVILNIFNLLNCSACATFNFLGDVPHHFFWKITFPIISRWKTNKLTSLLRNHHGRILQKEKKDTLDKPILCDDGNQEKQVLIRDTGTDRFPLSSQIDRLLVSFRFQSTCMIWCILWLISEPNRDRSGLSSVHFAKKI